MGNSNSRKQATALRHKQIQSKSISLEHGDAKPRFVADVMLGKLAKWLRIAGFDVLYSNRYTDDALVALSQQEQRILLSRDTRLLIRKSVSRFLFLESDHVLEQIRQVFCLTHTTTLPQVLTRCLACNEVLAEIPRQEAKASVPPYIFETQTYFKTCPRCKKIYWAGTHRQTVLTTLESLLSTTDKSSMTTFIQ